MILQVPELIAEKGIPLFDFKKISKLSGE